MKKCIKKAALMVAILSIVISGVAYAMPGMPGMPGMPMMNIPMSEHLSVIISSVPEEGFTDNVVVTLTSPQGSSHRVTLRERDMFTSSLSHLPSGTYTVSAHITQADVGGDDEFEHPYFVVEYPETVAIGGGDIAQLRADVVLRPGVMRPNLLPPQEIPPPPEPPEEERARGLLGALGEFIRNSWFTMLIAAIALIIWAALALKRMIYKEMQ